MTPYGHDVELNREVKLNSNKTQTT